MLPVVSRSRLVHSGRVTVDAVDARDPGETGTASDCSAGTCRV